MKHSSRLLLATSILLLAMTACGQKGPLIVERPATTAKAASSQEVTENDSVLNTQTEPSSPTR